MMDGDVQVERLGKVDASDAFSEVNRTVRIKQVGSGTIVHPIYYRHDQKKVR